MTTSQDFRKASLTIGQLAAEMKPADTDPFANERKLIQYHLNVAAGRTKAIAEALERTEGTS